MASFVKFHDFVEQLGKGGHQLHAAGHTLKCYLSNTAPDQSADTVKADLAEISAGNGYTAGGEDTQNDYTETTGTASCTGTDITWTASGGAIAQFRYVVLYNDTHASDALIGYWDYGSAVDLATGESFTVDFGSSMFTIA